MKRSQNIQLSLVCSVATLVACGPSEQTRAQRNARDARDAAYRRTYVGTGAGTATGTTGEVADTGEQRDRRTRTGYLGGAYVGGAYVGGTAQRAAQPRSNVARGGFGATGSGRSVYA